MLLTALLNRSVVVLAASILFKNWQRPENMTLQEFRMAKLVPKKEDVYGPTYIVSMSEHKTGMLSWFSVLQITHGLCTTSSPCESCRT